MVVTIRAAVIVAYPARTIATVAYLLELTKELKSGSPVALQIERAETMCTTRFEEVTADPSAAARVHFEDARRVSGPRRESAEERLGVASRHPLIPVAARNATRI